MWVFLISPVPITEPLTSELIDTPVFYNLAPRPIKYRVSVPIPIPRCKHLRGPDMDYTHSDSGQESQAKTVPSATAEEIQGLTSYL